jgi:hypothetical protein
MALTETNPELTALIYDENGGTHVVILPLSEEAPLIDRAVIIGNTAMPETEDITEKLALSALHGFRF